MTTAAEPVLRVESLGARAGSRWILKDVTFEARAGLRLGQRRTSR